MDGKGGKDAKRKSGGRKFDFSSQGDNEFFIDDLDVDADDFVEQHAFRRGARRGFRIDDDGVPGLPQRPWTAKRL